MENKKLNATDKYHIDCELLNSSRLSAILLNCVLSSHHNSKNNISTNIAKFVNGSEFNFGW